MTDTNGEDRDEIEALDPALIPIWRTFPIPAYTAILRSGKAAVTKRRYLTRDEAAHEAKTVANLIRYYAINHPELAPNEFGYRVWESAEDGRYRWAILPTKHVRRPVKVDHHRLGAAR